MYILRRTCGFVPVLFHFPRTQRRFWYLSLVFWFLSSLFVDFYLQFIIIIMHFKNSPQIALESLDPKCPPPKMVC